MNVKNEVCIEDFVSEDFKLDTDLSTILPICVVDSKHMLEQVNFGSLGRDGDNAGCVFALRNIRTGEVLAT